MPRWMKPAPFRIRAAAMMRFAMRYIIPEVIAAILLFGFAAVLMPILSCIY